MFNAVLFAVSSLAVPTTAAPLACAPLPGIEQVLARPGLGYLLIGEYHGTVEMPAVAADALCAAAKTGRPLVLGIELTPIDQPALNKFLASDGGPAARADLLASPGWREEGGRTTRAIVELIEAARRIAAQHPLRIVAFDAAPEPGTSPKREAAMAEALRAAAATVPNSLVVALTGVGHADKEGFISRSPPFLAAGGLLPGDRTISLAFGRPGGEYWGCHSPTGDRSRGCAVYEMPAREPIAPRGVVLDTSLRSGFDGLYMPGGAYSASRPAAAGL